MRMGRAAIFVAFALGICVVPVAAHAQAPMGSAAPQIQTAQTFLMTWGGQKWDEMKAVTTDKVTVKVGTSAYTLEPAAQKSEIQLVLPFRGLSTVRADGKITGVKIDDLAMKLGDKEMHGPATVDLTEDNGVFRFTGITAGSTQQASTQQ
jgi:hypothetical protein